MPSDLRIAVRMLLRQPCFTAVAIITLALGIGANAAIFSLVNALLLKPVMVQEPDRLVGIFQNNRERPNQFRFFSYPEFQLLRGERDELFEDVLAFQLFSVGVWERDLVREVRGQVVSGNFFSMLGVAPALGRTFLPEEEKSAAPVVVLSHSFWKRLGADPEIVGSQIRLAHGQFTVVGVMPEGFTGTMLAGPAVFLPMGMLEMLAARPGNPPAEVLSQWDNRRFMLVGRLKSGIDSAQMGGRLAAIGERLGRAHPTDGAEWQLYGTAPSRFGFSNRPDGVVRNFRRVAALAAGLSIMVLFVACLNLMNMMLARGAARKKEFAVRMALGAGRRQVLRQLLTEGFLLALLGGAVGLVLASWATTTLATFVTSGFGPETIDFDLSPDWRVLSALLACCVLATLFFAAGPAWKLARLNLYSDLKEHPGEDKGMARGGLFGLGNTLAIGQLAFSLALLLAAGLFTRSAVRAVQVKPGFDLESQVVAQINTGLADYNESRARELIAASVEQLGAIPGVQSVSHGMFVPLSGQRWQRGVQMGGAPPPAESSASPAEGKEILATCNVIGADYFKTLGVPLARGREFSRSEVESTTGARVAIVSQNFAEKMWPGEDPVGRTIQFYSKDSAGGSDRMEMVGIVPSMQWELFEPEPSAYVFTPFGQEFHATANLHLRVAAGTDPSVVMGQIRTVLQRLDPAIPLTELKTIRDYHEESMAVRSVRMGAMLFGAFGGVAVLLSFVGVYGLKSYTVARRTREIGIRMAVGAAPGTVVRMVLRESAWLTGVGLGLGFLLALAVGKVASGFLYGVSAFDPVAFAGAVIMLLAVALVACCLPARRAARIDPMRALRSE